MSENNYASIYHRFVFPTFRYSFSRMTAMKNDEKKNNKDFYKLNLRLA